MENARCQLEELDRIEQALVARIRRSSQWLPSQFHIELPVEVPKLSSRECAFQRWEAARLVRIHDDLKLRFNGSSVADPSTNFDLELKACLALSDTRPAQSLAESYAQHRSARGKERFVSNRTQSLISEFDAEYPFEEHYGQVLRLEPFYRALVAGDEVSLKPRDYRDYLVNFDSYAEFGDDKLVDYLIQFYNRAYGVGPGSEALDLPAVRDSIDATAADPLYCQACRHRFANEAVYNAHLKGRKHKRAARLPKNTNAAATPELIHALAQALHDAFASTIAEMDRKAGMTMQERKLEVEAIERERLHEDTMLSGEEGTDDACREPGPTRELLGPEGTPIPRWLYKLHGLSTTFKCEICQPPAKIAGRAQFERHFRDPKHLQSLRRLGITSSEVYKGITTPTDALELHKALKNEPGGADKEVEDDDGNVMSEKMMNDLKKQGLL